MFLHFAFISSDEILKKIRSLDKSNQKQKDLVMWKLNFYLTK